MKKGFSLKTWVDVTDGHQYGAGDPFPHDGRTIPDDRIEELATDKNQTGSPVIAVEDVPDKKPQKKDK